MITLEIKIDDFMIELLTIIQNILLAKKKCSEWNNETSKFEKSFLKDKYFIFSINLNLSWNYYAILKGMWYLI